MLVIHFAVSAVLLGPGICSPGLNLMPPGGGGGVGFTNLLVTMPVHAASPAQPASQAARVQRFENGSGPGTAFAPLPPKQFSPACSVHAFVARLYVWKLYEPIALLHLLSVTSMRRQHSTIGVGVGVGVRDAIAATWTTVRSICAELAVEMESVLQDTKDGGRSLRTASLAAAGPPSRRSDRHVNFLAPPPTPLFLSVWGSRDTWRESPLLSQMSPPPRKVAR